MKDIKNNFIFSNIGYICFYVAVIIEVMVVIIDKSNYTNPIEGRLFQITFVLFFFKVCLTRYTVREYVTIFFFGILGIVSYLITGRNEILRLVMLIAACKDVDMQKCLKLTFGITILGCIVIILLSVMGLYGSLSLTMDFGRGEVETRYTLGMGHPNALQCMVWALTALGLYLYSERMRWYHYFPIVLINFGAFLMSDSRTGLLVAIFTIIMSYLTSGKRTQQTKRAGAWLCGIATAGSIVLSVFIAANAYRVYNYDWYQTHDPVTMIFVKLNKLLNGRIRILTGTTGWEGSIGSWSLFSKPESGYYFDMGWVRLFYWYGIIPACIFIFVILALIVYSYKKEHYSASMLIAAFSVYSIIEAHAVSVYLARNYVFFLIGAYWCPMLSSIGRDKDNDRSEISVL